MEHKQLRQKQDECEDSPGLWLEPAESLLQWANQGEKLFASGDLQKKRLIVETVGSNLVLKNRKLVLKPENRSVSCKTVGNYLGWRATVENIRISCQYQQKSPEIQEQFIGIKELVT